MDESKFVTIQEARDEYSSFVCSGSILCDMNGPGADIRVLVKIPGNTILSNGETVTENEYEYVFIYEYEYEYE